jgi:osmoprotectant transport system permease protein
MTPFLLGLIMAASAQAAPPERPVVIASKPFGESFVLAEMLAQLLEARGFRVQRRLGLGATEIAMRAIRTGAIDAYPEYTGTGLVAVLGREPESDARRVFDTVSREFRERWGARWLPPLGFENTYAIALRRRTADSLSLRTLSDLARASAAMVAGFTPDFVGRPDGLPGLAGAYGLKFREVRSLLQSVKYQALASGAVDVIDGYSTDGFIDRYDLAVLEDDLGFFPAYEASVITGSQISRELPGALVAMSELSGRISPAFMRRLNRRVEVDGEEIVVVARAALDSLGLLDTDRDRLPVAGAQGRQGLPAYLWSRRGQILRLTMRHLLLVGVSLVSAALVGVALGLTLERSRSGAEPVIGAVGLLQVIPGIALLAFMIPLLGIGVMPALVALFLYSLYPIVRNTYSGVRNAGKEAVLAAEALGMTPSQSLIYVRLPLAAPIIMAGIRTAGVISVGTATLAAFIGAGGLGDPIVAGLALSDTNMILSGALPAAVLALLVDALLLGLERAVRPEV